LSPREGHLAREIGVIHWYRRNHAEANRYFDRSIELAPDQTDSYLYKSINYWGWSGDGDKARAVLESLPDQSGQFACWVWYWQEIYEGKYQQALDRIESTPYSVFRLPDMMCPKTYMKGLVHKLLDQPEQARGAFESVRDYLEMHVQESPGDPRVHAALSLVYAELGHMEAAIQKGEMVLKMEPVSKDALRGPRYIHNLAIIHMLNGDHEKALDMIEHILSIPYWLTAQYLRIDPHMDALRDHPRFQRLTGDVPGGSS
jgi:tetratricopeptide (TPR) repeat protein